jgi:hypothetical protein
VPECLTPVAQHFAVWDVQRNTGWVALYGEGRRTLSRTEIDDADDFGAIVSMLSERRGLCFDARREVIRHVPEPAPANGDGGWSR